MAYYMKDDAEHHVSRHGTRSTGPAASGSATRYVALVSILVLDPGESMFELS